MFIWNTLGIEILHIKPLDKNFDLIYKKFDKNWKLLYKTNLWQWRMPMQTKVKVKSWQSYTAEFVF